MVLESRALSHILKSQTLPIQLAVFYWEKLCDHYSNVTYCIIPIF